MLVMPKHVKMWQDSRRQQQQSRCCRAKEAATAGLVQGYSQAAECSPTLQQQQQHQRGAAAQISSAAHQATLLHFDLRNCPCVGKDNSSSSTLTFLPTPANSAAFPQIQSRKSYYAYLNLTMCPTTRGLHLSGLRSWPPQPAAPGRRDCCCPPHWQQHECDWECVANNESSSLPSIATQWPSSGSGQGLPRRRPPAGSLHPETLKSSGGRSKTKRVRQGRSHAGYQTGNCLPRGRRHPMTHGCATSRGVILGVCAQCGAKVLNALWNATTLAAVNQSQRHFGFGHDL